MCNRLKSEKIVRRPETKANAGFIEECLSSIKSFENTGSH
jgi:hypothetical protein